MRTGLVNINWNKIKEFCDEDISYYLFLEDKSIDAIAAIRNLNRETVQQHIIRGKIKFGVLSKCKDEKELFLYLVKVSKQERLRIIETLQYNLKKKLVDYIVENYSEMNWKDKESAIWLLGELRLQEGMKILIKSSVHNNVNIRRLSVSALGKMADKKGEMALIRALEDENCQVVSYALKSLKKVKSKKCKEKVEKLLEETNKEYVKKICVELLESINEKNKL
ncbi:HEAT repeat domain-containing protein [Hathewaya limosa]|uniref:HEAT repeat protein n=1 Tax=Hathewaya limosa TaxID=1536 RepID=A0ABU0JTW0_HATLI|nr:helix-turn-helix domain-containing protein [Hathewaya limosa]MDQ0479666.1 HEAT repeat protein [Hathewaya limosa]